MADTGAPWALPFPELDDAPDVPLWNRDLATAVHAALSGVQSAATAGAAAASAPKVNRAGDTMTGPLAIHAANGWSGLTMLGTGNYYVGVDAGNGQLRIGRMSPNGQVHEWPYMTFEPGSAAVSVQGILHTYNGITVTDASTPDMSNAAQDADRRWLCYDGTGRLRRVSDIAWKLKAAAAASARRFKDNITNSTDTPDIIHLRPVTFRWKADGVNDVVFPGERLGLIAEEVAEVDERLVTRNEDGDIQGLDQNALIAALVAVVKTQQQEIAELQEAVRNMR